MHSILGREYLFVAIVKTVMKLSAALEKEHGLFLHTARVVDMVENMISSNFLSGDSSQKIQCCIQISKFFLQRPEDFSIVK